MSLAHHTRRCGLGSWERYGLISGAISACRGRAKSPGMIGNGTISQTKRHLCGLLVQLFATSLPFITKLRSSIWGLCWGPVFLKASTFGVPRMGCINLHKGKVPEYRGMPPGFWELYDGASSASVTVRVVEPLIASNDASIVVGPKPVAVVSP